MSILTSFLLICLFTQVVIAFNTERFQTHKQAGLTAIALGLLLALSVLVDVRTNEKFKLKTKVYNHHCSTEYTIEEYRAMYKDLPKPDWCNLGYNRKRSTL